MNAEDLQNTMICAKLETIKNNIALAAERSGRDVESVQLVAVSKRQPVEAIQAAEICGQQIFGENYLQEAQEKISQVKGSICWHFIGHLQSNKAKAAVQLFDVVETVDRIKIARALDRCGNEAEKQLQFFVQVNIGREKQKHGVLPEDTERLLREIAQGTSLKIKGLMGMPPRTSTHETSRPYFKELKNLSTRLADKGLFSSAERVELSMGMSADYQIAIEEGATLVRVGTALFGERK